MIFGCLWILVSDKVLHLMTDKESILEGGQTLKGTLFVILSAILIYATIRYQSRRLYRKEKEVNELRSEAKERAFKASEEERNRIASELHDGIQQELAGISMMLEKAKNEGEQKELQEVQNALDQCIHETRNISHNLSSIHLDQKGLSGALVDLNIKNKADRPVDIRVHTEELHEASLSYFTALNLYRISQELLLNVSKHSLTQGVEISIQKERNGVLVYRFQEDTPHREGSNELGIGQQTILKRIESLEGKILSPLDTDQKEKPFIFSFMDPGSFRDLDKAVGKSELRPQ